MDNINAQYPLLPFYNTCNIEKKVFKLGELI